MNLFRGVFTICMTTSVLLVGCLGNRGIETGNPDLKGKTLTVIVRDSPTFYISKLLEDSALLSQIGPEDFETVSDFFSQVDGILYLETTFSDGRHVAIESLFDENGQLLELRMALNGVVQEVEFSVQEGSVPSVEPNRIFLELVASLCERIVACNTTFMQTECEAEILVVPGLSGAFGNPEPESMAEAQASVDSGELLVEGLALEECIGAIEIVPCSTIQKQFNDQEFPNFSKAVKIVPKPICARGLLR